MKYLTTVLALLKEHNFYAKESKCDFGMVRVEYLGHAISGQGLSTGGSNVELAGTDVKELRALLGLTGYYRQFVRKYGVSSKPRSNLLPKNGFRWDQNATLAFEQLKKAMASAPVLAMPDFTKQNLFCWKLMRQRRESELF